MCYKPPVVLHMKSKKDGWNSYLLYQSFSSPKLRIKRTGHSMTVHKNITLHGSPSAMLRWNGVETGNWWLRTIAKTSPKTWFVSLNQFCYFSTLLKKQEIDPCPIERRYVMVPGGKWNLRSGLSFLFSSFFLSFFLFFFFRGERGKHKNTLKTSFTSCVFATIFPIRWDFIDFFLPQALKKTGSNRNTPSEWS